MRLTLSAFVTGFATLGLEITALRLLAPAFGSNLLVFSNVVGVVLAGLATGATLGGRWADRRADPRRAGALMLAAGVFVALLPNLAGPFLDAARRALAPAPPRCSSGLSRAWRSSSFLPRSSSGPWRRSS